MNICPRSICSTSADVIFSKRLIDCSSAYDYIFNTLLKLPFYTQVLFSMQQRFIEFDSQMLFLLLISDNEMTCFFYFSLAAEWELSDVSALLKNPADQIATLESKFEKVSME